MNNNRLKYKIFTLSTVVVLLLIFLKFGIKSNISYQSNIEKKIKNIDKIQKIEIYDNDTLKICLKRKKNKWYLKDNIIKKTTVENLIKNINNFEVTQPIPFSYIETAKKNFNNYKRTLRIYGNFFKIYEINFYYDTIYHKTICFSNKKDNTLFFVKILGEDNENLLNLIPISEDLYIDKILINLIPEQIKKVRIEYKEKIDQSFECIIKNNYNIELYAIYPSYKKIQDFDIQKLKNYLFYFYSVNYEEPNFSKFKKGNSFARLYIEDNKEGIRDILFFEAIKIHKKEIDKNYCFAKINDKKFVIVDYYYLDPILRELNEFIKK